MGAAAQQGEALSGANIRFDESSTSHSNSIFLKGSERGVVCACWEVEKQWRSTGGALQKVTATTLIGDGVLMAEERVAAMADLAAILRAGAEFLTQLGNVIDGYHNPHVMPAAIQEDILAAVAAVRIDIGDHGVPAPTPAASPVNPFPGPAQNFKYYAVARGQIPGIYWSHAAMTVQIKDLPKGEAKFKGFNTF